MFKFFRARRAEKQTAYTLYKKLVAQARQPSFYNDFGVEDSIEGRFDMILLHLFMVDDRLEQGGDASIKLRRNLHEAMVADLDRSFREIGVGDMSVGKEMKKVGNAWLGRHTAYTAAFAKGADREDLVEKLANNIYSAKPTKEVYALAAYVRTARQKLAVSELEVITGGELDFPTPVYSDYSDNEKAAS